MMRERATPSTVQSGNTQSPKVRRDTFARHGGGRWYPGRTIRMTPPEERRKRSRTRRRDACQADVVPVCKKGERMVEAEQSSYGYFAEGRRVETLEVVGPLARGAADDENRD